jgi:flagellar biosynthesis/type III secretory pathway M-ring protein FliF/YscJ
MSRDPASLVLQQTITIAGNTTKANEINILKTRSVPGNYSAWRDHKFYIFGLVVLALVVLVIVATIYEESLKASTGDNDVASSEHHSDSNGNIKSDDKYEMNRMNNNNNNNEADSETNKIHQQNDMHELGEQMSSRYCRGVSCFFARHYASIKFNTASCVAFHAQIDRS